MKFIGSSNLNFARVIPNSRIMENQVDRLSEIGNFYPYIEEDQIKGIPSINEKKRMVDEVMGYLGTQFENELLENFDNRPKYYESPETEYGNMLKAYIRTNNGNDITLANVQTNLPRKGIGTELLKRLEGIARAKNKNLVIENTNELSSGLAKKYGGFEEIPEIYETPSPSYIMRLKK